MKTLLIFALSFAALAQDGATKPNADKPTGYSPQAASGGEPVTKAKAPAALSDGQKLKVMTLLNKANEARATIAALEKQAAEADRELGAELEMLSKDWPGWRLSKELNWQPPAWQPPQQAKAPPVNRPAK